MENRKVKEFEQKESSERSVAYDSQQSASSTTATNFRSATVASLPGNVVEEETKEETTPNSLGAVSEKKRSAVRWQQALEDHSDARAEGEDDESQQSSERFRGRASNPMASSSTLTPCQDDSLSSKKRFAVRRQALDDASGYDVTAAGQNYQAQRVAESLPSLDSRPGAYPVFPSGNIVNQNGSEDSDAFDDDMQEEHKEIFVLSAERVDVSMDELRQANEEMQEILTERAPQTPTSAVPLVPHLEEAAPRQDRSTVRLVACALFGVLAAASVFGSLVSTRAKSEPPIVHRTTFRPPVVLRNTFRPTGASSQAPSWKSSQAPSISFSPSSSVQPSTLAPTAGPCNVYVNSRVYWEYGSISFAIEQYFVTGQSKHGNSIGRWCVESVRSFRSAFSGHSTFNESLSLWDVSSAVLMNGMFSGALAFNQDLSSWNVSQVERMDEMFLRASSFNQDLSSWNVARVRTMHSMFDSAGSFNGNVSTWDVSRVEDMGSMFYRAYEFNDNISAWNVSGVVNMRSMFESAENFGRNRDLSSWNVSGVEAMQRMFFDAESFNGNITNCDVSRVRSFRYMFEGARSFRQDLCPWGARIQSDADISRMFLGTECPEQGDPDLTAIPVSPLCFACT